MKFTPLKLKDAFRIELEPRGDERGFFARQFCKHELAAHGISNEIQQANLSFSRNQGTLRGLHFQRAPHAECKLVRCLRGSLFDVLLDIRPDSPTFGQWHGEVLTPDNRTMLCIPEGFAHGFQTLVDETEILYLVTASYAPQHEGGVRWNDPRFNIEWPLEPTVMSDRDRAFPDFQA